MFIFIYLQGIIILISIIILIYKIIERKEEKISEKDYKDKYKNY